MYNIHLKKIFHYSKISFINILNNKFLNIIMDKVYLYSLYRQYIFFILGEGRERGFNSFIY